MYGQQPRRRGALWAEPNLSPAALVSLQTLPGELFVAANDQGVVACDFDQRSFLEELTILGYEAVAMGADPLAVDIARAARDQLAEYFARRRRSFETPLYFGDQLAFTLAVLDEVTRIPFGMTATYGEIGERAGHQQSGRAVGNIMATCSFSVLVPCHRVVPAAGPAHVRSARRQWLLRFEEEDSDRRNI